MPCLWRACWQAEREVSACPRYSRGSLTDWEREKTSSESLSPRELQKKKPDKGTSKRVGSSHGERENARKTPPAALRQRDCVLLFLLLTERIFFERDGRNSVMPQLPEQILKRQKDQHKQTQHTPHTKIDTCAVDPPAPGYGDPTAYTDKSRGRIPIHSVSRESTQTDASESSCCSSWKGWKEPERKTGRPESLAVPRDTEEEESAA